GPWMHLVAKKISEDSTFFSREESPIDELREIRINANPDEDTQHMLFYSVLFRDGQELMVGGCTDFSGEGGAGSREVLDFIAVLRTVYPDVPLTLDHYDYPTYE